MKQQEVAVANEKGTWEMKLGYELTFSPVTEGSPENKLFWKWTPSGEFHFTTPDQALAQTFKFRHDYYIILQMTLPEKQYGALLKFIFQHMRTDETVALNGTDKTIYYDLEFLPVSGTIKEATEEDKIFYKKAPTALLKFGTINEDAARMFLFGEKYYVILRDAELLNPDGTLKAPMPNAETIGETPTSRGPVLNDDKALTT
jgi:hypothetical protein